LSKPKVFIGSSSESIYLVDALFTNLDNAGIAEVTPWYNGVFQGGNYTMDDIAKQLDSNDLGVFILDADDITVSRESVQASPRDNVIFELGLFMGKLGKERVLFVTPNELTESKAVLIPVKAQHVDPAKEYVEKDGVKYEKRTINSFKVPSDLYGITQLQYRLRDDGNWMAALTSVSSEIIRKINHLNKKESPLEKVKELSEQIEILTEQTEKVMDSYEKLERLKYFIDQAKEIPETLEEADYNRILMALDSGLNNGAFTLKGITLFKIEEDARRLVQCGQFKNVGQIGKPFSLDYGLTQNDPINVVEAHNADKVTTIKKKFGNEYLMSIPFLRKFVVTLHYQRTIRVKDAEIELEEIVIDSSLIIDKLQEFLSKAPSNSLI